MFVRIQNYESYSQPFWFYFHNGILICWKFVELMVKIISLGVGFCIAKSVWDLFVFFILYLHIFKFFEQIVTSYVVNINHSPLISNSIKLILR